ncbi:DNA polymerase III subunit epsilon [Maricurvus nonylphenolicus]|uniref:DNA polymerase III subunit epsilon n=1 Tax=Maricurvus nonylphenolicus TaxID=1008307 RepID=UPI0036F32B45
MRQIVLDTETTGLEPSQGHRIIEIGCVELVDRKLTGRHYHQYIQPQREVDEGAMEVHGITNEFLLDKPLFSQIVDEFMTFVKGAELVIHNAPFDIGFLDHELRLDGGRYGSMADHCSVVDSLVMARQKHPGAKNNLDALCKRYMVDNSQRDLHGALLDAEILADVYLMMTGGQTDLMLGQDQSESTESQGADVTAIRRLDANRPALAVIQPSAEEMELHSRKLEEIQKASGDCLWLK